MTNVLACARCGFQQTYIDCDEIERCMCCKGTERVDAKDAPPLQALYPANMTHPNPK